MHAPLPIIVIDGPNIVHRSVGFWKSQLKNVDPDAYPTDWPAVVTFLGSMRNIVEELFPMSCCVFATEGARSIRQAYWSGYKRSRELHREKLSASPDSQETKLDRWCGRQEARCYNVAELVLPFVSLQYEDHEADDICAGICSAFADRVVVVVSGDSDMRQLLTLDNVRIYNIDKKTMEHDVDKDDPRDANPARWKALIGDASDGIPGLTGPITAVRMLEDEKMFQEALDTKTCAAGKNRGLKWRHVYERNLRLVSLLGEHRCFPLKPAETIRKDILSAHVAFDPDVFKIAVDVMNLKLWLSPGSKQYSKQIATWTKLVSYRLCDAST